MLLFDRRYICWAANAYCVSLKWAWGNYGNGAMADHRQHTVLNVSRPTLEGGVAEGALKGGFASLSLGCCAVLDRDSRELGRRVGGAGCNAPFRFAPGMI